MSNDLGERGITVCLLHPGLPCIKYIFYEMVVIVRATLGKRHIHISYNYWKKDRSSLQAGSGRT